MATYFISDLHLSAKKPHLSEIFLKFLNTDAKNADALYILGDLFETWLGDDNRDPHNVRIIEALAAFSDTGIPLYYMHGNRDFLIGEQFTVESHCHLLPDPVVVDLYNTPVLLTHGDLLCTLDTQYQRFRKFIRHPLIKKLLLSFPLSWRQKISAYLRSAPPNPPSKERIVNRKWDVTSEAVYQMLREHNAFTLVHGHTHKLGIHDFVLDNHPAKRIVLGDWGDKGNFLIFKPNDIEFNEIS